MNARRLSWVTVAPPSSGPASDVSWWFCEKLRFVIGNASTPLACDFALFLRIHGRQVPQRGALAFFPGWSPASTHIRLTTSPDNGSMTSDLALGVDSAPKIEHSAIDFQIDLIQMPSRMGLESALTQVRGELGPEMVHPAPDGLVGNHNPAFPPTNLPDCRGSSA